MRILFVFSFFFLPLVLPAQRPEEILTQVILAQKKLQHLRCYTERHDTLVTGHIRSMQGWANISVDTTDPVFGFRFYAEQNDGNDVSLYDGQYSFHIDHRNKEFEKQSNRALLDAITGYPGGQLIWQDQVRVDTSTSTGFSLRSDDAFYYLRILLPDITRYQVSNRYKELTISKKTLLPVALRQHQETLGKVQDLNYKSSRMQVNEEGIAYDFSKERYPAGYKEAEQVQNKKQQLLLGKKLPEISLVGFDGTPLPPVDLNGKLILLDFWEVWCGPCVESMPRVQGLYEKYKVKGLEVFGIIHQTEHLHAAKKLLEKIKPGFRMVRGNDKMKNDFSLQAVPLYILADRYGVIVLVSEGYPENLEEMILRYL